LAEPVFGFTFGRETIQEIFLLSDKLDDLTRERYFVFALELFPQLIGVFEKKMLP